MYTEAVLDHFRNPRNSGELPGATATVETSNPVCGDIVHLAARMEEERLVELRFKAKGCVTAMACASALTEMATGRTLAEAVTITPGQLADVLGGLPPATAHGAQLACDALAELVKKLRSGDQWK